MKHQLKGFELKNQMELATGLKATDAKLRACNATPVLKAPKCKPKSHQAPPAPAQAPKRRTPFTPALPIGYAYPQDALAANLLKAGSLGYLAQIANQNTHSALVNTGHGTLTTKNPISPKTDRECQIFGKAAIFEVFNVMHLNT